MSLQGLPWSGGPFGIGYQNTSRCGFCKAAVVSAGAGTRRIVERPAERNEPQASVRTGDMGALPKHLTAGRRLLPDKDGLR